MTDSGRVKDRVDSIELTEKRIANFTKEEFNAFLPQFLVFYRKLRLEKRNIDVEKKRNESLSRVLNNKKGEIKRKFNLMKNERNVLKVQNQQLLKELKSIKESKEVVNEQSKEFQKLVAKNKEMEESHKEVVKGWEDNVAQLTKVIELQKSKSQANWREFKSYMKLKKNAIHRLESQYLYLQSEWKNILHTSVPENLNDDCPEDFQRKGLGVRDQLKKLDKEIFQDIDDDLCDLLREYKRHRSVIQDAVKNLEEWTRDWKRDNQFDTLIVINPPQCVGEYEIKRHFEKFGELSLVTNEKRNERNYFLVSFTKYETFQSACRHYNHELWVSNQKIRLKVKIYTKKVSNEVEFLMVNMQELIEGMNTGKGKLFIMIKQECVPDLVGRNQSNLFGIGMESGVERLEIRDYIVCEKKNVILDIMEIFSIPESELVTWSSKKKRRYIEDSKEIFKYDQLFCVWISIVPILLKMPRIVNRMTLCQIKYGEQVNLERALYFLSNHSMGFTQIEMELSSKRK